MLIGGQSRDHRPAEWSGAAQARNRGEQNQEPEVARNRTQTKQISGNISGEGREGGRGGWVKRTKTNKRKNKQQGRGRRGVEEAGMPNGKRGRGNKKQESKNRERERTAVAS